MEQQDDQRQYTILAIDDEPGVRHVFETVLGLAGYQVYTAASGEEALDFLHQRAQSKVPGELPVDLIILDILMPRMDGWEVCRRIKGDPVLKYVPLLILTALNSLEDHAASVEVGADDYIAKPFRNQELLVRVRALLRIGQMQQELLKRNFQLHALRHFNESILQNMSNGLLAVDKDGRISLVNRAAATLLGCEPEAWVGQEIASLPASYSPLCELINQTLLFGSPRAYQEIEINQAGRQVPLRVSTSVLRGEDDAPNGVICILEDLRELKVIEAERRKLDRLALSGQMAASVAHEIRNPLLSLQLGVDYLEKALPLNEEGREVMQRLRRQLERLSKIVNEFLTFSRPAKPNLKPYDIRVVLDQAIKMVEQDLAERRIRVQREYDPRLGEFLLDAEQMERVFTNLILNARDAIAEDGEIRFRAYLMPWEQWRSGHAESAAMPFTPELVVIEVEDTGEGIPPAIIERIFEPFFTGKAQGTGLGLAIVQRIIQDHGGHISVRSQVGEGTTFTIVLPRRV